MENKGAGISYCFKGVNVVMRWLQNVHRLQHGFSFRSFTPFMMKILEDANEIVQKQVVAELFKYRIFSSC